MPRAGAVAAPESSMSSLHAMLELSWLQEFFFSTFFRVFREHSYPLVAVVALVFLAGLTKRPLAYNSGPALFGGLGIRALYSAGETLKFEAFFLFSY